MMTCEIRVKVTRAGYASRSESENKNGFQKYPFRARRGATRDQRTLKPRGAAASVNSTRGASRDGRGATKRSRRRGDRDAHLSRAHASCDSERAITSRALRVPVDASSVASGRRRNSTKPTPSGKANRGADVSIAAHLLPPRSAPARRGARSAEAVVRASADMLAGNGGGEPRARSCASVWSQPRARKRFPLDARRTYRVSTRVFRGSQSQTSTSRPGDRGFFGDSQQTHKSASFRHTPNSRRRGKHSFYQKNTFTKSRSRFFRRTNERTIPLSLVVTPPPRTALHHHFTHGQKCWQSACASSAVTHEGARAGCW